MPAVHPVHYRNLSPYIRFAHEIGMPRGTMLLNRTNYDHEFVYGIEGEALAEMNGQTYVLRAGDLLLIKPHTVHTIKVEKDPPFLSVCVHFDWTDLGQASDFSPYGVYLRKTPDAAAPDLSKRPADEFMEFEWPPFMSVSDRAAFLAVFRDIVRHFGDSRLGSKLMMKASFLELIALASEEMATDEGIPRGVPHAGRILKAVRKMKKRYAERITPRELAEESGLSPKYFGTLFKQATGRTVSEYLLDIRLEKAKELLTGTTEPIRAIAEAVGIPDVYYFSKRFRRKENMPPRAYRATMSRRWSRI